NLKGLTGAQYQNRIRYLGALSASPAAQKPVEPSAEMVEAAAKAIVGCSFAEDENAPDLWRGYVPHATAALKAAALTRSPSVERVQVEIDAGRYRYLRNRPEDTIGKGGIFAGSTPPTGSGGMILTEDDLDRAVDAAIAASPQPEGK